MAVREKFASQADPELLAAMREIAREEGRQLQVVIEQAMREYVERQRGDRPREAVMAHLRDSVNEHRRLYGLLAE